MKKIVTLVFFCVGVVTAFGQNTQTPYVILVSFDGFRSDYVSRFDLPNFKRFIQEGAAAEGLIPSFPSKTFPNHYTIVTGLYPGHHGLVDNSFYDPARKQHYAMKNREVVVDPYYYGGTTLWTLARQQGLKTASYFWVGSEMKEEGLRPDHYFIYNQSVPFQKRVDQVINWLRLPEAERPRFITLYFSSPDHESHTYGPVAEETQKIVLKMDSLLGNLVQRVDSTKLPVNIVLVSDHGMSELVKKEDTYIFMDEIVVSKPGRLMVVSGETHAHIYTTSAHQRDSLYNLLNAKAVNFTVYKREDFPARWHYDHDRSGDLLIAAKAGKYLVKGDRQKYIASLKPGATFGAHGYDPDETPEIKGIFYARGPNIKPGSKIPAFRNVHIYPFIAEMLKLKAPRTDGDLNVLKPIYK